LSKGRKAGLREAKIFLTIFNNELGNRPINWKVKDVLLETNT
jgi:hypothetical protein